MDTVGRIKISKKIEGEKKVYECVFWSSHEDHRFPSIKNEEPYNYQSEKRFYFLVHFLHLKYSSMTSLA